MIALWTPNFCRKSSHGMRFHRISQKTTSSWTSSKPVPAKKEKEFFAELRKSYNIDNLSPANIRFGGSLQVTVRGGAAEFRQFLSREAQCDDECWSAAWLRAESHWEGRENDRYIENYKHMFAEQEFNAMKQRYNSQLGEKCKCILAVNDQVKNEERNLKGSILKCIVGTLDLSIRHLSYGETFPGEQVKPPLFCLVNRKTSSRYGYIANLCVAKSARRQGIASNMLHFAILSAKEDDAEKVFVHVHRKNKAAQFLYDSMGFEVVEAANSQLSLDETHLLCIKVSEYLGQLQLPNLV